MTSSSPRVGLAAFVMRPRLFVVHLKAQVNRVIFITSARIGGDDAAGIDAPEPPSAVAALRTGLCGFTPVHRGEGLLSEFNTLTVTASDCSSL